MPIACFPASLHWVRGALLPISALLLSACGGGGGDDPSPQPNQPSVTITANPASIGSGQSTTLTWSSTNATSCTASQGWSGTRDLNGSDQSGVLTATTTFTLSCTGTGGTSSQSVTVTVVPPPTVTLTASPTTVAAAQAATLTWTATNATACTASGDWSGAKAAAGGTEERRPLILSSSFTLICTGVGGSSSPQTATVTVDPPSAGNVVITGKVEFERLPFKAPPLRGLDANNPLRSPVREAVIEVLDSADNNVMLGSTTTNTDGVYAVVVAQNRTVILRAKAQMLKTGSGATWNFRVLNNTNGDRLYAMDGTAFGSGTAPITSDHNLLAPSGWDGVAYSGVRVAAPFAILDTVYSSKELVRSAAAGEVFPALDLYWSPTNRAASPLCPSLGNIVTSFYVGAGKRNDCTPPTPLLAGIYVLGDFAGGNGDTDEFDQHVIAHEFGHYVEANFSRSDSIGGEHGGGDRLDLRLAFGEGWGNAYSAMALNDPAYRDSAPGVGSDGGFNLEADSTVAEGWFSESSVGEILWDIFDGGAETGDTVAMGFPPIFAVMTGAQASTDALTSIFSFATALRSANPAQAGDINALLSGEVISGSDAFGANEQNTGNSTTALPIYRDISSGQPLSICTSAAAGDTNKLGFRRFLRMTLTSPALLAITATGAVDPAITGSQPAGDPDIVVHRRGQRVQFSEETGQTETIPQKSYAAGTYIIEVYDFDLTGTNPTPRCMTVSVTG